MTKTSLPTLLVAAMLATVMIFIQRWTPPKRRWKHRPSQNHGDPGEVVSLGAS